LYCSTNAGLHNICHDRTVHIIQISRTQVYRSARCIVGLSETTYSPGVAIIEVDGRDSRRITSTSSFGSGFHLGSSVTFRNTFGVGPSGAPSNAAAVAEHHELFADNSSGPRRSCSITLAYPSERTAADTDDRGWPSTAAAAQATDHQASSAATRRDGLRASLFCPYKNWNEQPQEQQVLGTKLIVQETDYLGN